MDVKAPNDAEQVNHQSLSPMERLRGIRHVALDMDGTIYRGGTRFACTNPFLTTLRDLGLTYSFLTNNSSKSVAEYAAHLEKMDIPAAPEQIYTSTLATVEYLKSEHPDVRRLFVSGTAGMTAELRAAGYAMDDENPDAVIIGFDLPLNYGRLCRATWFISQGRRYFATHPDAVCPTDAPSVLLDCGSICAAIEHATGRRPEAVPGKPDPRMLLGLCRRLGLQPHELAMVGDRLYTDIEMARRAGALGVLVLSGEATAAAAAAASPPPDFVFRDAGEFGDLLTAAHSTGSGP